MRYRRRKRRLPRPSRAAPGVVLTGGRDQGRERYWTPLAGKIALVTGGSRGIGRAIAHKLAAAGCDVAVNYYNNHDQAESLCAGIRAMGRRSCAIQGDVGNPESVEEILVEFRRHFDCLDILVSNAATGVLKPALEMSLKHWRWCMETNALALTLLAQRAVPLMPAGGRIIAMTSLGATRAIPDYGFVGASKAALESLVRTLAQELGPRRILVNAVSAGVVDTDALRFFPNRNPCYPLLPSAHRSDRCSPRRMSRERSTSSACRSPRW